MVWVVFGPWMFGYCSGVVLPRFHSVLDGNFAILAVAHCPILPDGAPAARFD
jgi:hypothetical protein